MQKKESFLNLIFQIVSEISMDEVVVFTGDMNGHVGRINTGYFLC